MISNRLEPASRHVEPDIVRLTQELIRIPSYSFEEERITIRLQNAYEQLGYDLVFRDDAGNLVAVHAGSADGPTLLLLSHMDTARPRNGAQAEPTLLSGRVEQGRVHGLGSAAGKGALATQAYAGHLLDTNVRSYCGNLVVAATVGDCDGYAAGTAHLLAETLPRLDLMPALALLGGPTGLDLCNRSEGWAELVVRISGTNKLAAQRVEGCLLHPRRPGGLPGDSESAPGTIEEIVREPGSEPGSGEHTLKLGCRIAHDRSVSDWPRWIRRQVQAATGTTEQLQVEVAVQDTQRLLTTGRRTEIHCAADPWLTDSSDPSVVLAREALSAAGWSDVSARPWNRSCLKLSAAGGVLVGRHHIPTIGFGPGVGRTACGQHEFVAVGALRKAALGNAIIAQAVLNPARLGNQRWWESEERHGTRQLLHHG